MSTESRPSSKQAVRGVIWTYASYYSGKLMVFVSTIILARLLSQDDFGVAGYALIVINSLNVLSDLGVGQALIYLEKDPKATDTAFWLSILLSFILFTLTWLVAPYIGSFFEDPRAVSVTRALAFNFPLSSLGYIHDILLRKTLSFKRKFVPDLSRSIAKGIFSIALAYLGYGAWSLIYGQLIGTLVASLVLWLIVPWHPSFYFSKELARDLLRFGLNIVAISGLSVFLDNIDAMLIGKYIGAAALGIYTLAFRVPDMLVMQFNALVSKVVFPLYAKIRNDADSLKRGFLYSTRYLTLITVPMGIGVAVIARPLVLILFGEKWIDAIPVMQALSVYTVVISLVYNAGDVYKAQGRPEILTRVTLLEGVLLAPTLYFAIIVQKTIVAVGWGRVFVAIIITVIDLFIAARMLEISFGDIFKVIAPSVGAGLLMALLVNLSLLAIPDSMLILELVGGVLVGGVVYIGSLWIFQRDLLLDGFKILRKAVVR